MDCSCCKLHREVRSREQEPVLCKLLSRTPCNKAILYPAVRRKLCTSRRLPCRLTQHLRAFARLADRVRIAGIWENQPRFRRRTKGKREKRLRAIQCAIFRHRLCSRSNLVESQLNNLGRSGARWLSADGQRGLLRTTCNSAGLQGNQRCIDHSAWLNLCCNRVHWNR
jgi:hypothetical protein